MSTMKVKPVDPDAVICDPQTKLRLPADGGEVPDNVFWNRRLIAGEVVRIEEERKAFTPTGREPVAPLVTRGDK